ncbi:MAG: SH3-like domain-containing protein [Saprospiraceae bacterium]|nr:SH3-like domain-containing protein [Saprospiraceae bacterium]
MNTFKSTIFLGLICLLVIACDSKTRVIEGQPLSTAQAGAPSIPAWDDAKPLVPTSTSTSSALHEVRVKEILNTEKYSYLQVEEQGKEFWVAISKRAVKQGEIYQYKGGLLKKNFFSREFNRVFETVYLVSNIWEKAERPSSALEEATARINGGQSLPNLEVEKIEPSAGAISLAKLFGNKNAYNGKLVKIRGKCIKINPMIMGRNWVHIQDGSGQALELTVTTAEVLRLGDIVSLEGIITLDKDFGAGYRYDIIMEKAVLQ